jgi:hypothetical protein
VRGGLRNCLLRLASNLLLISASQVAGIAGFSHHAQSRDFFNAHLLNINIYVYIYTHTYITNVAIFVLDVSGMLIIDT